MKKKKVTVALNNNIEQEPSFFKSLKVQRVLVLLFLIVFVLIILLSIFKTQINGLILNETKPNLSERADNFSSVDLKSGDYAIFGKFNDEPILWRILETTDGSPLLFTEYIISLKAFDASGKNEVFHLNRDTQGYGSSDWQNSSIKEWLNSSDKTVYYSHCPPVKDNVYKSVNAYADEGGFLCSDNFSDTNLALIRGDEERVFLLSQAEMQKYFSEKQRAKICTKSAILKNETRFFMFSNQRVWYWTRSANNSNNVSVVTVTSSGSFYKSLAYDSTVGIAPALRLKSVSIETMGGNGTKASPYYIP